MPRRPARILLHLVPHLAGAALLALGACAHDWKVEQRETPVHVWIVAPELAARGGSIDALVYVGAQRAVQGDIRFPEGVTTVILPTRHVNAGDVLVQAVLAGGTISASRTVEIEHESWVVVTVRGGSATIEVEDQQPPIPAR